MNKITYKLMMFLFRNHIRDIIILYNKEWDEEIDEFTSEQMADEFIDELS